MKHNHSLKFHTWLLIIVIFMILNNGQSLRLEHALYREKITHGDEHVHKYPKERSVELFPTGSNLPDCSHACGPCFPCRRVMIGYKCLVTESCPVIYRCFCRGRYYHERSVELFSTGSNLPDCSHACGPCFPCRRVMIGYKCLVTESCPVIYRCFCRGRYYHVPTS
ncbi:hypothetical protein SSX86_023807 [Deinandra increscens subsp. villosa]|uniref:Epidermal patterning factor-like protein n=1 Tax=Deinandra increscens subsp. villosa TaxID=3103831 RepID=A0AAP0GP51_9ASTR